MASLDYERRKAVAKAWQNEKQHVMSGRGTRNWSPEEQKSIIATGKATGYQGHHMKNVVDHPSRAGDPNNIQFLDRKEHLAAHSGNFRNKTNGYYNPSTGEMKSFGKNKPQLEAKPLSQPLSSEQVKSISESASKNMTAEKAKQQAASMSKRGVDKTQIKGKSQSNALAQQRSGATNEIPRRGTTLSKTLSNQRSSSSGRTPQVRANKHGQSH